MFKHWMEIVYNHDHGLSCLVVSPEPFPSERVDFHNVSQWERFTLEELFRSPFTAL